MPLTVQRLGHDGAERDAQRMAQSVLCCAPLGCWPRHRVAPAQAGAQARRHGAPTVKSRWPLFAGGRGRHAALSGAQHSRQALPDSPHQ